MQRWTAVSAEPNSPEAKNFRRETLQRALRPPVNDRIAFLGELAKGKRVLDVGVVDHTRDVNSPEWLHRAIAQSAAYCLGIDILEEPLRELQAAGYNVRCADVTRDDLGEQFEVMIAGDVIEHLGSPENLFESANRLLVPGGRLVITTPNPYYWKRIRNALMRGYRSKVESVDHVTLMYPSGIAELAERAGMVLEEYRGVYKRGLRTLTKVASALIQVESFCETTIYECRRE